MEIFSHTFINAHIIGCSPVEKIVLDADSKLVCFEFVLYTTGSTHRFRSDAFNEQTTSPNFTEAIAEIPGNIEKISKASTWREAAENYINFIESINPTNYDQQ